MAVEAPAKTAVFTDVDRQELARHLCELLYDLWLRKVNDGGRTPAVLDARPAASESEETGVHHPTGSPGIRI